MRPRVFHIVSALMLLFPTCLIGQTVNIGDILCTDGSTVSCEAFPNSGRTAEGIVFYVDETGQGWAVSLECQAVNTHWVTQEYYYDTYDIPDLQNYEYSREALYDLDGYSNTAIIRIAHGADWYPAAWSVDFDNEWYLPAAGQLRWLMAYINEVNASLAIVHGTPFTFDQPRWYWASTERGGAHAVVVSQTGSVANYPKWNYIGQYEIGVRAVKSFTVQAQAPTIGEVVTSPNGQQGVVFYVAPDDGSYWIAAMDDLTSSYPWGPDSDISDLNNYNENNQYVVLHGVHCGYDATLHMREAIGTSNPYASSHVDFENGWHIPSAGQLSKLFAALPFIESIFTANGGSTLSGNYYWTSTECSNEKAWAMNCGFNLYTEGILSAQDKSSEFKVRPIWSEPCAPINLPTVGSITAPEAICDGESLTLGIPETQFADTQGWQLSETADFSNPVDYDGGPLGAEFNGWYLRYYVTNIYGTVYSNSVRISIWPTYTTSLHARACTSYDWNGDTYTESGDYTQSLTSIHGCDSIVTLHLTIIGTLTDEWSIEACDRYTWNSITYTEPGNYVQELESVDGCDSIVTLHLTFTQALEVETDTTACGSLSWVGQEYTLSGDYDHMFVTPGGCDSLVHLHLTVKPYPEAVGEIEGPTEVYVSTDLILGQYFYSIDSVGFADHYEWELEAVDWPMDTTGLQCALWVTLPGDAILRVKAWNGCGYTEREILIHAGFFDIGEMEIPVALYPNPTHDKVFIEAEGIRLVKVYDLQGQCVIEKSVVPCDRMALPLQCLSPGLYLIEIQTGLGIGRAKLNIDKL